MKKLISIFFICVIFVVCVSTVTLSSQAQQEFGKLKVGAIPFTVAVPLQYAYDKGYFEDEGLNIEIIMFSTGAPVNEAIAAERIDISVSGLASVFSLTTGSNKWIGEINSTGGMGIYVRPNSPLLSQKGKIPGKPNIYGSADLIKGMKFLGPLGTTSQFCTIRYVENFGLERTDIQQVSMEYGPAYQAFIGGNGDVLSASPPISYQAEAAGYIRAASFEDATDISLHDGIVVRNDVLEKRREEIVRFIRAIYKACDDLQDKNLRSKYSLEWFSKNAKQYSEEIMKREITDRDYFNKDLMLKSDYVFGKGMVGISAFFADSGMIEKSKLPNVVKSFDTSIIKDALGINIKVVQQQ